MLKWDVRKRTLKTRWHERWAGTFLAAPFPLGLFFATGDFFGTSVGVHLIAAVGGAAPATARAISIVHTAVALWKTKKKKETTLINSSTSVPQCSKRKNIVRLSIGPGVYKREKRIANVLTGFYNTYGRCARQRGTMISLHCFQRGLIQRAPSVKPANSKTVTNPNIGLNRWIAMQTQA